MKRPYPITHFFPLVIFILFTYVGRAQSAGFNSSYAVFSVNGGANAFYCMPNNTSCGANPSLDGAALGTFAANSNSLILKGAEHNVYKCGGADITSTRLNYRIYSGSPSGSFNTINIGYSSGASNGCSGEDQQWKDVSQNINVLNGLSAGNYTIEFYSDESTTVGTIYLSNSSNNYKATFTVVNQYYSKSSGNLNVASNWGSATDGSGAAPIDFTPNGITYNIRNNATPTIGSAWTVSGSGSKVVTGDGTNACNFTIPGGSAFTGTIDVSANATLTIQNTSIPTFGTLNTNSTINYAASAGQNITTRTDYGSVIISGSGTKSLQGATTMRTLTISAGTLAIGSNNLTVTGDFSNNASFSSGGGILIFGGTGLQAWADANGTTYPFVTVNNSGAGVQMSNDITIGALLLSNGVLDINGHTFTITALINYTSGTITGSSTSNMVIGSTAGTLNFTQTSAATRSLNNLTLNSGALATLGTPLDVYGTITLTAATLHVNAKNLTLKSTSTNTARIADLNTSILDGASDVTVERYIKLRQGGTGRAYRLLAPTVNTSGSIKANWQEGQMNSVIGTNVNANAGYGTHITGSGGNANGFDVTTSNAPSLYLSSNGVVPTYTAIGNTSSTTLNALTGYYLFIRGDRSVSTILPPAAGMPTTSTTLRTRGTLLQGDYSTFTNSFDITEGAMNLITNPYPSPIDWNLIYGSNTVNVAAVYTAWDPNLGTRGGFVTVTVGGVPVPAESGANQFIQPGQAFFVQATGAGGVVCNLHENQKVSGNNNNVFRTSTAIEGFSASLYFREPDGYRRLADGVRVIYDNNYSATVDANDAREINNWDENIAIAREGKHLALEFRPVIQQKDELPLFMNNMKQMEYEFQFIPSNFTNTFLKAELIDNFLGTKTMLSIKDTVVVPFRITSDPRSSAADRFKVVFGSRLPPIDQLSITAYQKGRGVQVEWTSQTETAMDHYELERSTDGVVFSKQTSVAAVGNSAIAVNYSWFDIAPQAGNNFYRVKATDRSGQVKYSDAARVTIGKGQPAVGVYPNPLSSENLGLQLRDVEKGTYMLSLYNKLGQRVFIAQLQHPGGTAATTVPLSGKVGKGIYQLELTGENNVKLINQVVRN